MSVVSGQSYVLVNTKSGTVLDLSAGDNRTVTGWAYNGGSNQYWTLGWVGNGWTFRNANSGTYLGIQGTPADGLALAAVTTAFVWDIWPDAVVSNAYRIFVPNTLQNWDLYNYGAANSGDPVTLWTSWNGTHQTWSFHQV